MVPMAAVLDAIDYEPQVTPRSAYLRDSAFPAEWKKMIFEGLEELKYSDGQDAEEALDEIWAEING